MWHIGGSTLPDQWLILRLSHGSYIGCVSRASSSLITESVCVAANGGCMGFFIFGGSDTAIMCSTISAGLFPEYGLGLSQQC